ncbi:branched-chain amino acid transport system permease protein [Hydrogenophaga palleronii]|uniref:Branched-chain amino acid transport system permease protein n=1 Tax=Hydrogenophaga palleronii TaxID=65655 RepID=A0ABU1WSH9_9BURK|nr:branched-chain amino acid ABC transporter permease [Hydrogenophaga palleronii]MDR7151862.1 branched-chain amino acid transport system permease protein [Hydrogenophaga palleronii]
MGQRALLTALVAAACVLPFVVPSYMLFQLTMVLAYALALLGLNLLVGFNGQISLGHGAFFALGAYTAAMLMEHAGWPYWATLPVAALVGGIVGYLFGLPALKLDGVYLAMATFALGVVTPQLLKYRGLETWTGGSQGLVLLKPDAPFGLPLDQDQWLYFFCLGVAMVLFAIAHNLLRGAMGLNLVAVRDHPIAAEAMGVNNARIKSITFGISALYTSVGGALSAIVVQFVAPDSFTVFLSITLLVGAVVGGLSSLSGAVFGAVFIQFVPRFAELVSKAAPWAVYGAILLVLMLIWPTGVAGGIARLRAWFFSRRQA